MLDFHEIQHGAASKHLVVHFVFYSKSDHKILNDGHFKILAIECIGGGAGIDPKILFRHFDYISVAIKASL